MRYNFFSVGLIFLVMPLGFSSVAIAQSRILDHPITMDVQEVRLEQVLELLSEQSGVSFSYSSRRIPVDQKVTIQAQKTALREVLDEIFENMNIEYIEIEGKLILQPATNADEKSGNELKAKPRYTVRGYIRDAANGASLIGATVYVEELNNGTIANPYGFYSLTLPEGAYHVQISYIGYETKRLTLNLTSDQVLNVGMSSALAMLEEIVINPLDMQLIQNLKFNASSLEPEIMRQRPSLMGEYDVIKSLETLPGVQMFRDGSTFFHVRGGHYDQNQILLDEAPIYNPSHLLGIFGSFTPEAVKQVKLYKGDLPAHHGGRISSVLDITTREGNLKDFKLHGSLGLMSSRVAAEGPIVKDKSSFFASGRLSHIQGFVKAANPDVSKFYFYDLNTKVNFEFNENNRLYFSAYFGRDDFEERNESGINWANNAATLRWNHVFNDKLFSNTTMYWSQYEYALITSQSNDEAWRSGIANGSIKTDFSYFPSPESTVRFGVKLSGHEFNPGNYAGTGVTPDFVNLVPRRHASEATAYLSHEQQLGKKFLLQAGLRLSSWSNYGSTAEYTYDDEFNVTDTTIFEEGERYNTFANLEPRLELIYKLNSNTSFKFNYARNAQYVNLITNSLSPFSSLEVWMPAGLNIEPMRADQLSTSWFSMTSGYKFSSSVYYKWMYNQIDYVDHANLFLNPFLESQLRTGSGQAYGFETMLRKVKGRLKGWLGYTYSRSFRHIPEINGGREYPTLWDRPHQFVANAVYDISQKSTFSGTFYLSTGAPLSTPTSFYYYQGKTVPVYDEKHNSRMPTYHRFDLAYLLRLNKPGNNFSHSLTFSIFNIYAQQNPVLQNFNKIKQPDGDIVVPGNVYGNNEVIPSKIFVYNVIPSITYNFSL